MNETIEFANLPETNRDELISSGIVFMRAITETWGPERGMEVWDKMAEAIDPDYKGAIFFSMLTGNNYGDLVITKVNTTQAVMSIKAIRTVTGYGLKEAKDVFDRIRDYNKQERVTLSSDYKKSRSAAIRVMRDAGCSVQ
jgi:hypothetical protein